MVYLNVPELPTLEFLDEIPRLLDFYQEGFFIYEFEDFKTSNLIFTIPSPIARGGEINLMISIIVLNDEETDLSIFQETLEQFTYELTQIKDVNKAFESGKNNSIDNREQIIKIEKLLNSVYLALPRDTISTERKEINLVMFDFFEEGESQLAQLFKNYISNAQYSIDKSTELNLHNYTITLSTYSLSKPRKSIHFFLSQLKNKHGIIFGIDVTNKSMFRKAKITYNKILRLGIGMRKMKITTPFLILINKPETYRPEIHKLGKYLDVFRSHLRNVKYIPTDPSNNEKIRDAFSWIINKIILRSSKSVKEQTQLPIP
ncbi:MAG: hypothetical protein R3255_09075 [Candidatus Lokiarchaeia archaeon]|nr:hypothetical protein [Candidatus Lokiarchaeia archaeon]